MYMRPDILRQLVNDHQHQLLHEAEVERQVRRAHVGQSTLSMRVRHSVSALLNTMGRASRPRNAAQSPEAGDARSLA